MSSAALGVAEVGQHDLLGLEQVRECGVDCVAAFVGQPDQNAAAVVGMLLAGDQAAGTQPVHPVGHGAGGDQGLRQQLARGQLIGVARSAERGKHVELPGLQAVGAERRRPATVEKAGQPADPRQHLHRRHVQVRPLPTPGIDEPVDLVDGLLRHSANPRRRRRCAFADCGLKTYASGGCECAFADCGLKTYASRAGWDNAQDERQVRRRPASRGRARAGAGRLGQGSPWLRGRARDGRVGPGVRGMWAGAVVPRTRGRGHRRSRAGLRALCA